VAEASEEVSAGVVSAAGVVLEEEVSAGAVLAAAEAWEEEV
jgi:hypothetical protein